MTALESDVVARRPLRSDTSARRGAPLLERRAAMVALCTALRRARAGHGSVVVVSGEAGIGRSSLIRAFLAGPAADVRVLAGACARLSTTRGLAALRDAVRDAPYGRSGPLAAALSDPGGDVAAALLAELSGPPTVLSIDDVHRADDATVDVLCHVARRVAGLPVLLVLGVCADELSADHPVRTLLGALHAVSVTHVDLAPLSTAAVATLAGPGDGAALHRLTGGNPFLVTAALAGPGHPLSDTVADAVADAVMSRVSRLRPGTIAAVERLAVLPDAADALLVKALLGDGVAALVQAEERGFITVDDGGRVAFRHELARRAIVAALPGRRRRDLHADVVAALRDLGATDLARLVHHAVAAADAATVLEFAPAAARAAAAAGSHRRALAHLEAAVGFADRLAPAARVELFDELARHLAAGRRVAEAIVVGRRALALATDLGLAERHIGLTAGLAHYLLQDGEPAAADRLVEASARWTGPKSARADIALLGADLRVRTGRYAEVGPLLRQVRELADDAAASAAAQAVAGVVTAATDPGRGVAEIRAALDQALDQARDQRSSAAAAWIYVELAEALRLVDDRDALAVTIADGRQFCAERGLDRTAAVLDLHRNGLRMRAGELATAERGLRALAARPHLTGAAAPRVEAWLGRLLARRGDPGAAELIHRAWRDALRRRDPVLLVDAGTALAEWAWLTDSAELAEQVAERVAPTAAQGELLRMLRWSGVAAAPATGHPDPYERAVELGLSGGPAAMAEGCAALEAMGAHGAAARVRRAMIARGVTGHRVRRAPKARPRRLGLTERQLAVLELVAHGNTSAVIATRLGLSKRTVDHHVAAILTKLDVGTRREAVEHLRAHRA